VVDDSIFDLGVIGRGENRLNCCCSEYFFVERHTLLSFDLGENGLDCVYSVLFDLGVNGCVENRLN
jgi:hypothetical protein